eukprot:6899151-Prorocentrum_lima.AAC.1
MSVRSFHPYETGSPNFSLGHSFLPGTDNTLQYCLASMAGLVLTQNWTLQWLVAFCHLALPLLQRAVQAEPLSGSEALAGWP